MLTPVLRTDPIILIVILHLALYDSWINLKTYGLLAGGLVYFSFSELCTGLIVNYHDKLIIMMMRGERVKS